VLRNRRGAPGRAGEVYIRLAIPPPLSPVGDEVAARRPSETPTLWQHHRGSEARISSQQHMRSNFGLDRIPHDLLLSYAPAWNVDTSIFQPVSVFTALYEWRQALSTESSSRHCSQLTDTRGLPVPSGTASKSFVFGFFTPPFRKSSRRGRWNVLMSSVAPNSGIDPSAPTKMHGEMKELIHLINVTCLAHCPFPGDSIPFNQRSQLSHMPSLGT